jgi:FAD:protein FMN transferase
MPYYNFQFKAMACQNTIKLYASSAIQAKHIANLMIEDIKRIEKKYSRYRKDSLLSQINASSGVKAVSIDNETATLLQYAQTCYEQSQGLFDITSGVLRQVWDFTSQKIPTAKQINQILTLVGWDKVNWTEQAIFLSVPGMEIDFGGIGKEYAVDRAASIALDQGIDSGFINLGGDIRVLGPRPQGLPWQVAISHPRLPGQHISQLSISQGAIASSGDYERYMIIAGKRYHHIINPHTGFPQPQSFQAVSVLAEQCIMAGSFATIAMLSGEQHGILWLEDLAMPHLYISSQGELINKL